MRILLLAGVAGGLSAPSAQIGADFSHRGP
jgi:hypothetical protein